MVNRGAMVVVLMLLSHFAPAASAVIVDPDFMLRIEAADASAALGTPLTESSLDQLSLVPPSLTRRVTKVVATARACIELGRALQGTIAREWSEVLASPPRRPIAEQAGRLNGCARNLEAAAATLAGALDARGPHRPDVSIDLWPLLRIDTSRAHDVYEHDYAILIDGGGNDTYLNNAGGNLLDLKRGPEGSKAPVEAPARGCRNVGDIGNLTTANVRMDPECVPAVAVLIDSAGNDQYGQMEDPGPADDAICTADRLVRRIMTAGAGFAGVGVLIDNEGNDVYLGKTGAVGAGHVGGTGFLRDAGGADVYRAIRNSQGFGLVGGTGILEDQGGNDLYDFYMPTPTDPAAEFQERGSGGVIDDTGLCDNLVRQLQATAQLGGTGTLIDWSGNDRYVAAEQALQDFHSGVVLAHGSQAFGSLGGYGILYDAQGRDAYLSASGSGMAERGDGLTRGPATFRGTLNTATFVDRP